MTHQTSEGHISESPSNVSPQQKVGSVISAAVVQPILVQEGLLVQVELLVQGEPQVQVELQVPAGFEL